MSTSPIDQISQLLPASPAATGSDPSPSTAGPRFQEHLHRAASEPQSNKALPAAEQETELETELETDDHAATDEEGAASNHEDVTPAPEAQDTSEANLDEGASQSSTATVDEITLSEVLLVSDDAAEIVEEGPAAEFPIQSVEVDTAIEPIVTEGAPGEQASSSSLLPEAVSTEAAATTGEATGFQESISPNSAEPYSSPIESLGDASAPPPETIHVDTQAPSTPAISREQQSNLDEIGSLKSENISKISANERPVEFSEQPVSQEDPENEITTNFQSDVEVSPTNSVDQPSNESQKRPPRRQSPSVSRNEVASENVPRESFETVAPPAPSIELPPHAASPAAEAPPEASVAGSRPVESPTDLRQAASSDSNAEPDPVPTADRARFVQRVSGALRQARNSDGLVQLKLSPPELGSLKIEITVKQGVVTAQLEAETTAARNILLDNLPALRERLAEQEIRIEKFDVDVRDEGRQQQKTKDLKIAKRIVPKPIRPPGIVFETRNPRPRRP